MQRGGEYQVLRLRRRLHSQVLYSRRPLVRPPRPPATPAFLIGSMQRGGEYQVLRLRRRLHSQVLYSRRPLVRPPRPPATPAFLIGSSPTSNYSPYPAPDWSFHLLPDEILSQILLLLTATSKTSAPFLLYQTARFVDQITHEQFITVLLLNLSTTRRHTDSSSPPS
ncbi:hypothetical protein AVEN_118256-1 [Araneus ventricosus]|uniref:F-box domain-containing protein n=1 Tax=Araneus ventricosus TaxID=182803 RepID=A0A4Y2E115_ARAVE|nr:hypothetical protein AVEN_118256-1 [Araneus ventricosus]